VLWYNTFLEWIGEWTRPAPPAPAAAPVSAQPVH
jgi:hypothetical protein